MCSVYLFEVDLDDVSIGSPERHALQQLGRPTPHQHTDTDTTVIQTTQRTHLKHWTLEARSSRAVHHPLPVTSLCKDVPFLPFLQLLSIEKGVLLEGEGVHVLGGGGEGLARGG